MTHVASERRSLDRAAATVLVLVLFVLVSGCDSLGPKPSAPGRHERLPERTGVQAAYDLLDALLTSPVTVELPPPFSARPVNEGIFSFQPVLQYPTEAVGGVAVAVRGAPGQNGFYFDASATVAAAEASLAALEFSTAIDQFEPPGFGQRVRCWVFPAPPLDTRGFTNCRLVIGAVTVGAYTQSLDEPRRGNVEQTLALLRTGMAHLETVQAEMRRIKDLPAPSRVVRVGLLGSTWSVLTREWQRFHQRLAELGYVRGHNLVVEYGFSGRPPMEGWEQQVREEAAALVRARVDVIAAAGPHNARAAQAATTTIPIVYVESRFDPVALGLVSNLARPGGNLTGVSQPVDPGLTAKRLELLVDAVPGLTSVGVLEESTLVVGWWELELAAQARGVQLVPLEVHSLADVSTMLASEAAAGVQAILQADTYSDSPEGAWVLYQIARPRRQPTVRVRIQNDALLVYAPSSVALWNRAAEYVDKMLRGANPAETPVEQVKEYDLLVNLGVARDLGLTIAPSVLARATLIWEPDAPLPRQVR
jgi:putative ABC transport system substrate-binding protein